MQRSVMHWFMHMRRSWEVGTSLVASSITIPSPTEVSSLGPCAAPPRGRVGALWGFKHNIRSLPYVPLPIGVPQLGQSVLRCWTETLVPK